MTREWQQRQVLITGGSRGIGLAMSHAFARLGAQVIATSQSESGCQNIEEQARLAGLDIHAEILQLENASSREAFIERLKTRGVEIDTLINNAGMTSDQLALRMKSEHWYQVLESNLSGTFFVTQALLKSMLRKRFGRIISLSSIVALTGNIGQVNYCASKAGIIGMSKALAMECGGRGVTVNVIAPGFIETEMTAKLSSEQQETFLEKIPVGRFGTTDDIAQACIFLSSAGSSYITGQVLHVNGGLYCGS